MVDLDYLRQLLPILKLHNVRSFGWGDNGHISFDNLGEPETIPRGNIEPKIDNLDHHIDIQVDESKLPPDLRTDAITDYDKILNWSGSPDEVEIPIPLVNDQPLDPEVRQERLPAEPP